MPKVFLTGLFILALLRVHSQRLVLHGRVVDSVSRSGLVAATVSLVKATDSVLLGFGLTDTAGRFRLEAVGAGPFLLSVSYVGYQPVWRNVTPGELGEIELIPLGLLEAARVTGRRPPVVINNDTIEFNAENFKTQPNAVVEDMLKKIPGVTVESDGTVKVNGQTVKRVLVNGKEFFTGDVKMATKNLNADAVDKLQVFDRKSDQATFTGVDDGNSEKAINIQLKKDRNHALFGKVTAGGGAGTGNEGRYDGQANINRFNGDEQLSLLAMANNTNRQGFSMMDVLNFTGALAKGMNGGGGEVRVQMGDAGNNNGLPVTGLGQNQQGVARTMAGGVNYNNSWNKGQGSINVNYTASKVRLVTDRRSVTGYVGGDSSYNTDDTMATVNTVTQHRMGLTLEQPFDPTFSLRFTPTLTLQHSTKSQQEGYSSFLNDSLLNDGVNQTGAGPGAMNATGDLLFRKRLAKKGRTLSLDLNVNYNHSTDEGNQFSDNTFSLINQRYQRDAEIRSFGGNLTYTEPIGSRSLVILTGFYNLNSGNTDKSTSDYNSSSGKYDLADTVLSNHFRSDYRYGGGGVGWRSNGKKVSVTLRANIQAAGLESTDLSAGNRIHQHFTDVLPSALLQYNFSSTRNLRLDYNTYTTEPSVAQLQPVADLSNPLDVSAGNPALKRAYNQSLSLTYFVARFGQRKHLMLMLSASDAANAIVSSDSVTPFGTRMTTPVNANGVANVMGNISYGFPIRKWHSLFELGGSVVYSANAAFINGTRNDINSLAIRPSVEWIYIESEKLDLSVSASVAVNTGRFSLQPTLNTNYVRQHYGVDMTNALPWGLSLHDELDYIINTGRPPGYNTKIPLWNISLAKSVMKHDRGEIKFSLMDVLNKNNGITRSVQQGSVVDEQYNVLQRYFLLSFTYSLNKSGLKTRGGPQIRVRTLD
jgi:hypothetical protein